VIGRGRPGDARPLSLAPRTPDVDAALSAPRLRNPLTGQAGNTCVGQRLTVA
jgi:hypothetical protein